MAYLEIGNKKRLLDIYNVKYAEKLYMIGLIKKKRRG
jgi:hypothetical protein